MTVDGGVAVGFLLFFMACSVKKEVRVRIQVVSACTFSTRLDEKLWEHVTSKKM